MRSLEGRVLGPFLLVLLLALLAARVSAAVEPDQIDDFQLSEFGQGAMPRIAGALDVDNVTVVPAPTGPIPQTVAIATLLLMMSIRPLPLLARRTR